MYPKMFSTDFIFRQQENLVDNQKCQAGFRPLCNKILILSIFSLENTQDGDNLFLFWENWGHHKLLSRFSDLWYAVNSIVVLMSYCGIPPSLPLKGDVFYGWLLTRLSPKSGDRAEVGCRCYMVVYWKCNFATMG